MTRVQARETAREILEIIPLVMRTVAAELRAAGEMPAPAHFGLLSILAVRPRMLTELAVDSGRQPADDVELDHRDGGTRLGAARGAGRRSPRRDDRSHRRGRTVLERVGKAAEAHLSQVLAPLDLPGRRRLLDGLGVLRQVFAGAPTADDAQGHGEHRRRKSRIYRNRTSCL